MAGSAGLLFCVVRQPRGMGEVGALNYAGETLYRNKTLFSTGERSAS